MPVRARAAWLALVVALTASACSRSPARPAATTTTTTAVVSLDPALLSQSQLRRVPGFSNALVFPLPTLARFDDPDPRGPCGGRVPTLDLANASGTSWRNGSDAAGAQLVVRGSPDALGEYMTARIRDGVADCPAFRFRTRSGGTQEAKFERAIAVTRNADQSLAVVMATRVAGRVRAQTVIEVRTGAVLSRALIVTDRPLPGASVRGIASVMARLLSGVD